MVTQVTLKDKFKFGIKRTCRSCGVNFYDLDKHPSECPNCGALYELHVTARSRRVADDVYSLDAEEANIPFDIDTPETESEREISANLVEDDPFDLDDKDD